MAVTGYGSISGHQNSQQGRYGRTRKEADSYHGNVGKIEAIKGRSHSQAKSHLPLRFPLFRPEGLLTESVRSMCQTRRAGSFTAVVPASKPVNRFNVRIDPELHAAAAAESKSLNEWIIDAIKIAAQKA